MAAPIFARTASCPCSNPCPCSPCTCGGGGGGKSGSGGGGKSKTTEGGGDKTVSKHHEGGSDKSHGRERGREGRGREHGHGGAGISVYIPEGLGARPPEGDPFAVGRPPTGQTQEKTKTKKPEKEVSKSNPFDYINLNRKEAKGEIKPNEVVNVSDIPPTLLTTDSFERIELTGKEAKSDVGPPTPENISNETDGVPSGSTETRESKAKEAPVTEADFKQALDIYQHLRDRFPGTLPDVSGVKFDHFLNEMHIALGDVPRHFILWLKQNPDELAKVMKAVTAQHSAEQNYSDALHKYADSHNDKYGKIKDSELWFTEVHENFDPTPEGKRLGEALWNANLALNDAFSQARAKEDPAWGSKWAKGKLKAAQDDYKQALQDFFDQNEKHQKLKAEQDKGAENGPESQMSEAVEAQMALDRLEKDLEKDFQKTPTGQKALEGVNDAKKTADKAIANEKEAQKKVPMQAVKN